MSNRAAAFGLSAVFLIPGSGLTIAADPVTVYLKSPTELSEQNNLETVLHDLPIQKSKWAAFANSTVTYVVRQQASGLLTPDLCEGLPIHVKMSRGRLQSAYYESSGGRCRKGQSATRKSPTGEHLYLTPDDFFLRIAQAKEQLRCYKQSLPRGYMATSLRVTYDGKLGLPTKLEDYSENLSDYYWSLEVTEITVDP